MYCLNLPYPPSTNRMWRSWRGRVVLSTHGRAYKQEVARIAKEHGVDELKGDLRLRVYLLPKRNKDGTASKTVMDLSNCLKVVEDALQGVCYGNDKQVKSIRLDYGHAVCGGGLMIKIEHLPLVG